jgi:hypothetical protein
VLSVIRPVTTQHRSPECERSSRPPRVSGEGVAGESGPFIFYPDWACSDNYEVQDAFFRTHHPIMSQQAGLTFSERRFHAVPDDE